MRTEILNKFSGMSALEIRICTRSYRIFYVPSTSDALHVRNKTNDVEKARERLTKRVVKQRDWLDDYIAGKVVLRQKAKEVQAP